MEPIATYLKWINGYLWGPPMLVLLFGTHLYFTCRLRFIQRFTGLGIRLSITKNKDCAGDVSQFGALATALAATIGTGNIVGVATAVAIGGPGAVLWCWLTGVFGIATKYAEAVLAVKYRVRKENGTLAGGPMYALERGLKMKWAAVLFATSTAVAAFGIGNMAQANSISTQAANVLKVDPWLTGGVMAVLTAVVILGGIRSISRVCEALVPLMAVFYVVGCLIVLATGYARIPETILLILRSAFTGHAAAGGFAGATVMIAARYGVARGLFSNESGLGSAPIVAAAAQTRNPVQQALVSATGTFWDTVVVCAITGLVIVNSGAWQMEGVGHQGNQLTTAAFAQLHAVGPVVLTVGLITFVFSTILGWSYYGEKAAEYLLGSRAIKPYRWLWVLAVVVGSVTHTQIVWDFADAANAMMAIPNLVALLLLSNVIVRETREYLWSGRLDAEGDPVPEA